MFLIKLVFFIWFPIYSGYKAFVRYMSIACLFNFLMMSFEKQKHLILMEPIQFSPLYIMLFFDKYLISNLQRLSLLFSSGNYVIWAFTFKFMIHFEFIFVYGVKLGLTFTFSHIEIQLFYHSLLKRLSFLYWNQLCWKLAEYTNMDIFLPLYSVLLIYMSIFTPVLHCLDYCRPYSKSWN